MTDHISTTGYKPVYRRSLDSLWQNNYIIIIITKKAWTLCTTRNLYDEHGTGSFVRRWQKLYLENFNSILIFNLHA